MKKFLFLLLFVFFFSCGKKNSLELNFSEQLKDVDFKIEMRALGSNIPKKVIYDGSKKYEIPFEYGENEWYFSYKDSVYAYFRHIKTNRNDGHNYNYNFIKEGDRIKVEIIILGVSKVNRSVYFSTNKIDSFTR